MNDEFQNAKIAWHGGEMNDFDLNSFRGNVHKVVGLYPYAYLSHKEVAPYRAMASQYVLSDRMFPTEFGGSFTSHQDLIAGSTFVTTNEALVDSPNKAPWGCDAPKDTRVPLEENGYILPRNQWIFPCIDQYPTIADTLDAARVSWKVYVSSEGADYSGSHWSAFDAIDSVRFGPDWISKIVSPASAVLKDAASGKLSSVSWVVPDLAWSDDSSQKSDMGPSWVAAVVNAIGTGPQWNSTAIVILWSGWGGWYDDAGPPQLTKLMRSGFGIRVPCIIISPFAKKGTVTHELYQFGSLLRFIEESFDVPSLQSLHQGYVYTDSSANSISDSLNLDQAPRVFVAIPAKYPQKKFIQSGD